MRFDLVCDRPIDFNDEVVQMTHVVLVPALKMAAYAACWAMGAVILDLIGIPRVLTLGLLMASWIGCSYKIVPGLLPSSMPDKEQKVYSRLAPLAFMAGAVWGGITFATLVACFIVMPLKYRKRSWIYYRYN